ncbi:hypothetical protein IKF92_01635 [Candidatus Saccharibacteria bacterium]|nr:hypothetical protein [Candidatus Saccharibacteria bacterium]
MDNTYNLLLAIIVISALGTLAHFYYDWSGHNRIIGLFTAVNESTWEHIKIALTPTIIWSIYDGAIYGRNPNYFLAKILSLLVIVVFIPTIFYSYQKITKKSLLFINIIIFYLAIVLSQLTFYAILALSPVNFIFQYFACLSTFVFFGCYMTLTLEPLKIFLFKDPISGKYGFHANVHIFKKRKKSKKSVAKTKSKS